MGEFSSGPVSSVAISPDARLLAAATGDSQLSVAPLKRPLSGVDAFQKLSGDGCFDISTPQISCLCFPAPDLVYTATTSGSFARYRVCDTDSPVVEFEHPDAHGSGVELTGIAAVNGESVIVTSGKDGIVRVFDPETRQSIARLSGHKYEVRAVAVAQSLGGASDSIDEVVHIVASAGRDRTVRIFDVRASESNPIHIFAGHSGWVHDVAISGGGPNRPQPSLVSCAGDKTVRVWNLAMMKEELVFTGHEYRVWGVAVAPDSTFALSGSTDATVRAWNMSASADSEDDERCHLFQGHRDSVISVDVSRDGNLGVSGCEDGSVHVWDTSALFGRTAIHAEAEENIADAAEVAAASDTAAVVGDAFADWSATKGEEVSMDTQFAPVESAASLVPESVVAENLFVPSDPVVVAEPVAPAEPVDPAEPAKPAVPVVDSQPEVPAPLEVQELEAPVDPGADSVTGIEATNPSAAVVDSFEENTDSAAATMPIESPPIVEAVASKAEDTGLERVPQNAPPKPRLVEADLLGLDDPSVPAVGKATQVESDRMQSLKQLQLKAASKLAEASALQSVEEGDSTSAKDCPETVISALNERLTALSGRLDILLAVEAS